jgi:hypothetical protein
VQFCISHWVCEMAAKSWLKVAKTPVHRQLDGTASRNQTLISCITKYRVNTCSMTACRSTVHNSIMSQGKLYLLKNKRECAQADWIAAKTAAGVASTPQKKARAALD